MKIIFAGTPDFAATALKALINSDHEVVLVLTQPDRPAGRGMKTTASAVKLLALEHSIPLLQPSTLRLQETHASLNAYSADLMVVAAYGLILPAPILNCPRHGCFNIHASLLPRWRGAAPIQRTILAGDQETGISIMKMDAGLDTGAILFKERLTIEPTDTAQILHDKLSQLGAHSLLTTLSLLQQGKLVTNIQTEALACYAPKINKAEAAIDWQQDAEQVCRLVRAFNPTPGAYTQLHGNMLKIWQVKVAMEQSGKPGEILAIKPSGITVGCGNGATVLEILQKPGGSKLSAAEFLSGKPLQLGDYFGSSTLATINSND